MSRAVWFVAGAAAGVYGAVRARRAAESLTPDGLRDRAAGLSLGARLFADEVRTGAVEKETELRQRLELVHDRPRELDGRRAADGVVSTGSTSGERSTGGVVSTGSTGGGRSAGGVVSTGSTGGGRSAGGVVSTGSTGSTSGVVSTGSTSEGRSTSGGRSAGGGRLTSERSTSKGRLRRRRTTHQEEQ